MRLFCFGDTIQVLPKYMEGDVVCRSRSIT
nr:MAG TPA: zinc finger protein [Caudoviricetes sp.]